MRFGFPLLFCSLLFLKQSNRVTTILLAIGAPSLSNFDIRSHSERCYSLRIRSPFLEQIANSVPDLAKKQHIFSTSESNFLLFKSHFLISMTRSGQRSERPWSLYFLKNFEF